MTITLCHSLLLHAVYILHDIAALVPVYLTNYIMHSHNHTIIVFYVVHNCLLCRDYNVVNFYNYIVQLLPEHIAHVLYTLLALVHLFFFPLASHVKGFADHSSLPLH